MTTATAELHRHISTGGERLCILASRQGRWPGRVTSLSAAGAFVETIGRPPIGSETALAHPEIGAIVAEVAGHSQAGISLSFAVSEESSAFAYAVTAHDMTVATGAQPV